MSGIILAARDVAVVRGGRAILDRVDLEVPEGEVLSLIGPNGSGKTTLLQCLAALIDRDRGEVAFRGAAVTGRSIVLAYRRRTAMVFQEPLLFDTTVRENIASGLRLRGNQPRADRTAAVEREARRFGISHLLGRSAGNLSGGEAQRTSLARAFAIGPEILFLDEPFSALDPPTREALLDDLEQVVRDTKTTTLLATHDQTEALRLSDRIAVLNGGRVAQIGRPAEIMNHPADPFVAAFVGTDTLLPGRVQRSGEGSFFVSLSGREIEAAGCADAGESVLLCIRPENVIIAPPGPLLPTSARNAFPGIIERILPANGFFRIRMNCGFPLSAYVTGHAVAELGLAEGKEVTASFKATAIHVLRKKEGSGS